MRSTPADQTAIKGVPIIARTTWRDQDGEPAVAGGPVTWTAYSWATLTTIGTGTATHAGGGIYEAALPASTALDRIEITWSVGASTTPSTVDVAGGTYFTVSDARAADASLADVNKYPSAAIIAKRSQVEREIEDAAQVAFVPRFSIVEARGNGTCSVQIPLSKVRSVRWAREITTTGTQILTVTQKTEGGYLTLFTSTTPGAIIQVGAEHGHDLPPAGFKDQSIVLLRSRLNQKNSVVPGRAERYQAEGGLTYFLSMPGARKTGLPELDALIARHGVALDGIA